MPELNYEDFENIKKRYFQTSKDSKRKIINYIFAGGGCVKLLLDADKVSEVAIKKSSILDQRKHKDLEIYAFNDIFGNKNPNPHDICGINFYGPPFKLNYEDSLVQKCGIYLEILRGYYFDFLTPKQEDVRKVLKERKIYFTTSPEFLIASKIMSSNGLREDIDNKDAENLVTKFKINERYLRSIAKSTDFNQVLKEEDISDLEKRLKDKTFFRDIENRIKERYHETIPLIEQIPYSELISLLKFTPEELKLSEEEDCFLKEIIGKELKITKNGMEVYCFTESERHAIYNLCSIYILQYAPFNDSTTKFISTSLPEILLGDEHRAISLCVGINKVLSLLKNIHKPEEEPELYSGLTNSIIADISTTPYMHVKIARYKKILTETLKTGNELKIGYEN